MTIEAVSAALGGADSAISAYYQKALAGMTAGSGLEGTAGVDATASTRGADFGAMVGNHLSTLAGMESDTNTKSALAATGQLEDVHDYVIAATEMQTATELTTTVRNKALEAFSEIMRMQL